MVPPLLAHNGQQQRVTARHMTILSRRHNKLPPGLPPERRADCTGLQLSERILFLDNNGRNVQSHHS